ncbi:TrmH family RNA methyltransferase [Portibacter marinus]|uniref:TrmH family RNA methyltransferase n=1 Tax=Portibacter marinus TaxID=2898660 RepID=UPI001F280F03|nr:RNA methyltransferase [Portibacter marinus]
MTDFQIHLTEQRANKIKDLASRRQLDLAVVLENVHDPHNIGAVMRTCDAVGIPRMYMIVTDARVWEKIELGINASSGARKWVDVFVYDDCRRCFNDIRQHCNKIIGTHLSTSSTSLYDVDFLESTAIVFGNEHSGLSEEVIKQLDGNFVIPQFGMVQSLNISVACAVSCYEALRQRVEAGIYENHEMSVEQKALHQDYRSRNLNQHKGQFARIISNKK